MNDTIAKQTRAHIRTFARTFSDIEHVRAFLDGSIRMQTIDYFRKLESTDKALRGDAYEGLSAIFQPAHIGELVIAGIPVARTSLAGPMLLRQAVVDSWHVFCLHTIGTAEGEPDTFESLEEMRNAFLLDDRCTRLGGHLVFLSQPLAFLERVHAAVRALGYGSRSRPVTYYDELVFSGHFGTQ